MSTYNNFATYNHSKTPISPDNYNDLYEAKIQKRLRCSDMQTCSKKIEKFYTDAILSFGYFINRYYLTHTISSLNNPKFFNNSHSTENFQLFNKELAAQHKKIKILCKEAFNEFVSTANLHIAEALSRQLREKASTEVYPPNQMNFSVQREVLIQKNKFPKNPVFKIEDMEKYNSTETINLFISRGLVPKITHFAENLCKNDQKLLQLFKMSERELGQAIYRLDKKFTEACTNRIAKIARISS